MIPAAMPIIGVAEEEAVMRVLRSGMVAQGPEVAAFEEEFSRLCDGRRCIAVNSGTSALPRVSAAASVRAAHPLHPRTLAFGCGRCTRHHARQQEKPPIQVAQLVTVRIVVAAAASRRSPARARGDLLVRCARAQSDGSAGRLPTLAAWSRGRAGR